jgi:peroxiredoxin Q/BCP
MKKLALFSLSAALLLSPPSCLPLRAIRSPPAQPAPGFTLPSQDNTPISLSEYKGKWVVLYFYPKDFTGGCTLEAHNFQRDLDKYKAANAVVLGVSLDTADSHKGFCTKESLTFKLLADPKPQGGRCLRRSAEDLHDKKTNSGHDCHAPDLPHRSHRQDREDLGCHRHSQP